MNPLIRQNLHSALDTIDLQDKLPLVAKGKVRDIFAIGDSHLLLAVSDRVSVFDRVVGTVPFKGQILNSIANWWMDQVSDIVPHHKVMVPHAAATVVKRLQPLPVEVIVRGYLTGNSSTSIWTAYARGERTYCGHSLPEGLERDRPLPSPIVTPTTKGEVGAHDELISRDEIVEQGLVPAKIYDLVEKIALSLFNRGQESAALRGLILADTKYEFGLDAEGTVHLIDEIHTPDSSRYWYKNDYAERVERGDSPRGLDKDYVRNYMKSVGYSGEGPIPSLPDEERAVASQRYLDLYELLMGKHFEPDLRELTACVMDAVSAL